MTEKVKQIYAFIEGVCRLIRKGELKPTEDTKIAIENKLKEIEAGE